MLHEGLGCVAAWRDFPKLVSGKQRAWAIFVYSRFGYGRSDPVPLPRPLRYMHDEAEKIPAGSARCRENRAAPSCSGTATARRSRWTSRRGLGSRRARPRPPRAARVLAKSGSVDGIEKARDAYEARRFAPAPREVPRRRGRRVLGMEPRVARSRFSRVEHRGNSFRAFPRRCSSCKATPIRTARSRRSTRSRGRWAVRWRP